MLKVNRFDQRERLGSTSQEPALADRLQVREVRSHDASSTTFACRSARPARSRRWPSSSRCELAGTTVSRASLHNADEIERKDMRDRRHRGRRKGGQDHPAHRPRREARARRRTCRSSSSPRSAPSARRRWSRTKGASTSAARTPTARRRSRSGSATSPAATRWTSKGWATSWSISSSTTAW